MPSQAALNHVLFYQPIKAFTSACVSPNAVSLFIIEPQSQKRLKNHHEYLLANQL